MAVDEIFFASRDNADLRVQACLSQLVLSVATLF